MADVDIKIKIITDQAEIALKRLKQTSGETTEAIKGIGTGAKSGAGGLDLLDRQLGRSTKSMEVFRGIVGANLFFQIGKRIKDGIQFAITSMADFESALVGVGRTSGLEGKALEDFGDRAQELGKTIPVPTNELLKLAQISAQLGVKGTANLLKFTETGAKLAVATDLGAEQAISSLARILTATGQSVGGVDRLGSALVDLGNNFNATESQIVRGASEIAKSTAGFGLKAEDTLAIATALSTVGVQAETGGSQIGLFFNVLDKALINGGKGLQKFENILGLSGQQIRDQFGKDPVKLLTAFTQGLGRINAAGGSVGKTLAEVGLSNIRAQKTFRPLVNASNTLVLTQERASAAVAKNTALNEEAGKQFSTVNSSITIFTNSITTLFQRLGELNSGPLKTSIDLLSELATAAADAFNPSVKTQLNNITEEIIVYEERIRKLNETLSGLTQEQINSTEAGRIASDSLLEYTLHLNTLIAKEKELRAARKNEAAPSNALVPGAAGGDQLDAESSPEVLREQQIAELTANIRQQAAATDLEFYSNQQALKDSLSQQQLESEVERINLEAELKKQALDQNKSDNQKYQLDLIKIEEDASKARLAASKKLVDAQNTLDAERVADRRTTLSTIATLSESNNKTLAAIGKAAALTQIAIDGPAAVVKAFEAFPPPFSFIAAAATSAAIAAQAAKVAGVGFEDGGIVGGTSFSGDNVTARVNSGEMILNRQQQAQLFAQANGAGSGSSQQEIVVNSTVTLDGEVVGRAVSRQVANGLKLGEVL